MAKATKAVMAAKLVAIEEEAQKLAAGKPELRQWVAGIEIWCKYGTRASTKRDTVETFMNEAEKYLNNIKNGVPGIDGRTGKVMQRA